MSEVTEIIEYTATVRNVYMTLAGITALNPTLKDGQVAYVKYPDGSVGEFIGDGVTPFTGLSNILTNSAGINKTTIEFNLGDIPAGIIVGSWTPALLAKHGKCPSITIRYEKSDHPEHRIIFDDDDNPTAYSINLGTIPTTKTRLTFI